MPVIFCHSGAQKIIAYGNISPQWLSPKGRFPLESAGLYSGAIYSPKLPFRKYRLNFPQLNWWIVNRLHATFSWEKCPFNRHGHSILNLASIIWRHKASVLRITSLSKSFKMRKTEHLSLEIICLIHTCQYVSQRLVFPHLTEPNAFFIEFHQTLHMWKETGEDCDWLTEAWQGLAGRSALSPQHTHTLTHAQTDIHIPPSHPACLIPSGPICLNFVHFHCWPHKDESKRIPLSTVSNKITLQPYIG